jgi:hypothetical protein
LRRILLFAATTGYQVRSFADAAQRLGVAVTLATDRCHIMDDPWGDRALPVRFEDPEQSAVEVTGEIARLGIAIDGVVAVADKPTLVAALTAKRLGVPWHPPEAALACRDKHRMRVLFAEAGLPTPSNFLADHPNADTDFPCVLKPLGLSGSRGVIRANDRPEFTAAFERIRKMLNDPDAPIQVERYIPGREFALEGLMSHGELRALAIFDKPDPLDGPFFEESIYVTPSSEPEPVQQAIVETTRTAARALGLWHGAIHAEMRVNGTGVYMLEIAARPIGGLCAKVLKYRSCTLEELIVLHAIGDMPAELTPSYPAAGVMMIPVPRAGILESVSGVEAAREIPGIEDVVITAKPGERLVPLPEGSSYTGFIFANGPSPAFVIQALRRSHAALRFDVLTALDVLGN